MIKCGSPKKRPVQRKQLTLSNKVEGQVSGGVQYTGISWARQEIIRKKHVPKGCDHVGVTYRWIFLVETAAVVVACDKTDHID